MIAHTTIKGVGDVINGILHPFATLSHLLLLFSLGLLYAQRNPFDLKKPLLIFAPTAGLGLCFTVVGWIPGPHQALLLTFALSVSVCVAANVSIPGFLEHSLLAVSAFVTGLDSGVDIEAGVKMFKLLAGNWLGLVILFAYTSYYASLKIETRWVQIGIRIMGSWIVAISIMVLALKLQ